jgi:hypothetical protein
MDNIHLKIDELYEKYKNDALILKSIENYVLNILPKFIEDKINNDIILKKKREKTSNDINYFIDSFLSINRYFYSKKNIYFTYDNTHFNIISDDDVYHNILSSISINSNLLPYKFKLKNIIIKKIKNTNIFDCIPESDTIQYIISLLVPSIFSNRNNVKHFLTSIGDSIQNKNNKLIYICNHKLKELISHIKYYYNNNINTGQLNNYKFKYHEQSYNDCRFFKTNTNIHIKNELYKHIIDLLCISNYYSNRYVNADNFVNNCNDIELYKNVYFTYDKTFEDIVDNFLTFSIKKMENFNIKMKHMIFLWKKYIESNNIPNIIYYDNLINILNTKLNYSDNNNQYLNITSIYLPDITKFTTFFDEHIIIDNNYVTNYIHFELDELITLYHSYNNNKSIINEILIIEIINSLYNDIIIEDNKYILNIKCNLWDKYKDIEQFLEEYKISGNQNISLCDLYKLYIKSNFKFKMSKKCFEDICKDLISDYINENNIISNDFLYKINH